MAEAEHGVEEGDFRGNGGTRRLDDEEVESKKDLRERGGKNQQAQLVHQTS